MDESKILKAIADLNTKIEAMQETVKYIPEMYTMLTAAGQNNVVVDVRIDKLESRTTKLESKTTKIESQIRA